MRNILILTLILLFGCQSEPVIHRQYWEPSVGQTLKAEKTARRYAIAELGVSEKQVMKMETKVTSWKTDEADIIGIGFYDPEHFPNWGDISVLGGFPHYFRISVDSKTGTVVDHYASPE